MKKIFLLWLLSGMAAYAQKPILATAKTTAATVYFNAAELSQTVFANVPKGTSEIVVKNVADNLVENSIRVGAPSGMTILSVQFTNKYVDEYKVDGEASPLKQVNDSIKIVEKRIDLNTNLLDTEAKTIEMLDANQKVLGGGTGNLAELTKWLPYYRSERLKASNAYDQLATKGKSLAEQLQKLRNRLETDSGQNEKTSKGKLILRVMNETANNAAFSLDYLTQNASWTPSYDLRVASVAAPIKMAYKAQIVQTTGIDWKQVRLKLSSGNPSQSNEAPVLQGWFLQYRENEAAVGYGYSSKGKVAMNSLNKVSVGLNVQEARDGDGISDWATVSENTLNVSFDIDIPYDILSNGKTNTVTLKDFELPASYQYYAAPVAENEAYLLARIPAYGKYNLLPGQANIIFEDMYVGKTYIDANQATDTLSLSLGRDKKIAIKREKIVEKSGTKFLSSKKEQNFTYEITVKNNKKEKINLMLKDQYPLSTDKDMEIELRQSDGARVNPETGVLTWEPELKPGETKKFRISYSVRSPKDKVIQNL